MTIREVLEDAKEAYGWNTADLSRELGKKQQVVSRWLSGEAAPDSDCCDVIARRLGVDKNEVRRMAGRPTADESKPHTIEADPREQLVFARVRRILETIPPEQWLDHTEVWEQVSQIARGSLAAAGQSPFLSPDQSSVSSGGERTNETPEGGEAPLAECKIPLPVRRRARDLQPA